MRVTRGDARSAPGTRERLAGLTGAGVAAPDAFRYLRADAPVAQLDRALPSEGKGQRFESPRARQQNQMFKADVK